VHPRYHGMQQWRCKSGVMTYAKAEAAAAAGGLGVARHDCWEHALEVIIEMIVLPCIHDIL
jgi:hypothetical protein